MESKCFYFSTDGKFFTSKMEIRNDGKIIFEDLQDERNVIVAVIRDEDIPDFAEFLIESGKNIETFFSK